MASDSPISVAFLWHMHQPWYLLDSEGEAVMPWVRLHALKDYYDMPLLAQKSGIPVTINVVPCLLKQIELISAHKSTDSFWEAFLPEMSDMEEAKIDIVVSNFFDVNYEHHIKPSLKYSELFAKKGNTNDWRVFSKQEIRDLQMHFIIAWLGQSLRNLPEVQELIKKDSEYSIDDKNFLIKLCDEHISKIIPFYRKLAKEGQIQFTTTPYYHPILPLLCDLNIAKKSNPMTTLPKKPFMFPADAVRQVKSAVEYFLKTIQVKPTGMWLSEGSVSEEILPIVIDAGIEHIFSDEDILRKSLELSTGESVELTPNLLYRPYCLHRGKHRICIFFRDKRLSDKIGFSYYNWNEDDAISDFESSLLRIRDALPSSGEKNIVSVILDGENAWEYYRENGEPFLSGLYERLMKNPHIEPTTFQSFLDNSEEKEISILDRLAPGSWIGGNFDTWLGAEEKNRAWELLSDVRNQFHLYADKYPPALRERIMHHIMVAEGSDWFWWFGETNYTPYIDVFDALFRHHLRRVYQLMEQPIPPQIEEPIERKEKPYEPVRKPLQFMTPSLEGKTTNYFEWSSAGFYRATGFRGAMYGLSTQVLNRIYFGFDPENLYLRFDSNKQLINFLKDGGKFILEFINPIRAEIVIYYDDGKLVWKSYIIDGSERVERKLDGVKIVCDQICEMKIPFVSLKADP
ncbi:hypothetical protein DRQ26_06245, partial [bacterium]